jgi:hypothetical protein
MPEMRSWLVGTVGRYRQTAYVKWTGLLRSEIASFFAFSWEQLQLLATDLETGPFGVVLRKILCT